LARFKFVKPSDMLAEISSSFKSEAVSTRSSAVEALLVLSDSIIAAGFSARWLVTVDVSNFSDLSLSRLRSFVDWVPPGMSVSTQKQPLEVKCSLHTDQLSRTIGFLEVVMDSELDKVGREKSNPLL